VLMVHGLTQNGRTFDVLAQYLCGKFGYTCICPDMLGRGKSSWADDPSLYNYDTYLNDVATLISVLDVEKLYYVGISMGGLIGINLVSHRCSPVTKIVINDIGPFVPKEAQKRIGSYLGKTMTFSNRQECQDHLSKIWEPFKLSGETLSYVVDIVTVQEQNSVRLHYDPQIAKAFAPYIAGELEYADLDITPVWNKIDTKLPIMLVRGETSDLLLPNVVQQMKAGRESNFVFMEIPGVGHAPMFFSLEEATAIAEFLNRTF